MLVVYAFVALCAAAVEILALWPTSAVLAVIAAPFAASLSVLLCAAWVGRPHPAFAAARRTASRASFP